MNYTVMAGFGDTGGEANYFTPQTLEFFVGDTGVGGALEPHTVTFGPKALLDKLANSLLGPIMQMAGPPIIALYSQAAYPIKGTTYDGTGFAISGFLLGKGRRNTDARRHGRLYPGRQTRRLWRPGCPSRGLRAPAVPGSPA